MNLYVFGNSIAFRKVLSKRQMPNTFVDILFEKYNVPEYDHSYAVACCSEERILYFLKKTHNIDVAIIFHALPEFFFVPTLHRDFTVLNEDDHFWKDMDNEIMNTYPNITKDKPHSLTDWRIIRNDLKSTENTIIMHEFRKLYYDYLKHFYTHDLVVNRHYGALIQIDQYLTSKKIPVIHCTLPRSTPSWFKFSSGIVDTEITKFQYSNSEYYCSHAKVNNAINELGNKLIAEKLSNYIEQLVGVMGVEPT